MLYGLNVRISLVRIALLRLESSEKFLTVDDLSDPRQHKEKRWRYRGPNQNLRRIFGEYRKIDRTPKTLLTLKQENIAADHKLPKFNYELMGRKPSPRFVALTAALKVARGKKDHREREKAFLQLGRTVASCGQGFCMKLQMPDLHKCSVSSDTYIWKMPSLSDKASAFVESTVVFS